MNDQTVPAPSEVLDVVRRLIIKDNLGYEIRRTELDAGDAGYAMCSIYSTDDALESHFELRAQQTDILRIRIVGKPRRREWTEGFVQSFELLYNSVPDSHKRQALNTLEKG